VKESVFVFRLFNKSIKTPHFESNYTTNFNRKEGGKMDYEKINKAMMEVLEEKYNIKIEAKVERRDKDER
jgi:hypothetical protein